MGSNMLLFIEAILGFSFMILGVFALLTGIAGLLRGQALDPLALPREKKVWYMLARNSVSGKRKWD